MGNATVLLAKRLLAETVFRGVKPLCAVCSFAAEFSWERHSDYRTISTLKVRSDTYSRRFSNSRMHAFAWSMTNST